MHNVGQVFDALYQEVVLGDRLSHTEHISLLKGVASNKGACHLSGDGYDGGRIHEGCCQSSNKIGGSGAAGGDTDAHLARCTSIAIGSVGSSLFMPHQHMAQAGIRSECIVKRHDSTAGVAVEEFHPLAF